MKKISSKTAAFVSAVILTATAGFTSFPEPSVSQKSVQAGTVGETKAPEVTEITRRTCETIGTVVGLSDPRKLIYPVSGTFNPVISIGEFGVNSEGQPVFYNIENVDCYLVQMENGKIIKEFASWNTSEEPQKIINDVEFNFESKYDSANYVILMDNLPDKYFYEPGYYYISYSPHELMYDIPYGTDGMIALEPIHRPETTVTSVTSSVSISEITDISSETEITTVTDESTIVGDYITMTQYDSSPMKIGETRAVRFWNPEDMTSKLQYFFDYSHNFDYSYEEGSDTIYITAKEAGQISFSVSSGTAFSGGVSLTVTDEVYNQKTKGDVTGDGITDLTDLTEISLYLIKDRDFTENDIKAADTDNDGKITLADLARIKQYISNIISSLE